MKWYKNIFRRKVNDYEIGDILKEFIKPCDSKIIIHYEVTYRGIVKIYTNRPGIIIGKGGKNIKMLTERFKNECNVKDVKLYDMKNIVSNCGGYYNYEYGRN